MDYRSFKAKIDRFLACQTIAVIGVSHHPHEPVNANYRKLKEAGYNMIPVNPNLTEFEGVKCFPHIGDVPGDVDAALIFTHPNVTLAVVEECYAAGVSNIWIHRGIGGGSRSDVAAVYLKDKPEVNFIDGACPMMFIKDADWFHKGYRNVLKWTGAFPG